MKHLIKSILNKSILYLRSIRSIKSLLDIVCIKDINPELFQSKELSWKEIDRIYTASRRRLRKEAGWRYGSSRVHEVSLEGFQALSKHSSIEKKVYCDLGCGFYHPIGIAAVMFLNGASSTISIDIADSDHSRAAEALADLLIDCLAFPEKWNWTKQRETAWNEKIRSFDLIALQNGDLNQGIGQLPLQHLVTDIHAPQLEVDSIDWMTSRAVLEHFLDFELATKRLYAIMKTGAIAYHHIDLVDHRAYEDPNYHFWSFLAEDEEWSDGLCNRLRSIEIRSILERTGFEILEYSTRSGTMPVGFPSSLKGRFREMSEEELSITGVFCTIQKP